MSLLPAQKRSTLWVFVFALAMTAGALDAQQNAAPPAAAAKKTANVEAPAQQAAAPAPAPDDVVRAFQQKVNAIADLQLEIAPASDRDVRAFRRKLEVIADPRLHLAARRALNMAQRPRWGRVERVVGEQPSGSDLMQLEIEMAFVRKVCAPELDQLGEIRKELQKCLTEAAQSADPIPCDEFLDRLTDAVASRLSRSEAARYRAEVKKRRAHERAACVDTFVAILDQQMGLSEAQRQALVAALLPKWRPDWSQTIEVTVGTGDRTLPGVPDALLDPLLDAEQKRIWKEWPKNRTVRPVFNGLRIGSTGVAIAVPENP